MDEYDLAYVAGFFDGEGSATIRMVKATKNGKRYPRLEARITQNTVEVLEWIRDSFGFGGVYAKADKRAINECWDLRFSHKSARLFLTAIEPHLRIKRAHVTSLLDVAGRETT